MAAIDREGPICSQSTGTALRDCSLALPMSEFSSFEICYTCAGSCADRELEFCCSDVDCAEGADMALCDGCCSDLSCEVQPCDAGCLMACGTLPVCVRPECITTPLVAKVCSDCGQPSPWPSLKSCDSSSANTSTPLTPEQSLHSGQHFYEAYEYDLCTQAGHKAQRYDGSDCTLLCEYATETLPQDNRVLDYLSSNNFQPGRDGLTLCPMQGVDDTGASSMDPHHCHWNNCDLSFLDSSQFDLHFLYDHLNPLNSGAPPTVMSHDASASQVLTCAWDSCQTKPKSVPALLDHVKHVHIDTEQHHRCRWLVTDENGKSSPCNICLKTAKALSEHIIEHHIGARQKQYTCYWQDCERCTRPFAQRQKILRHIAVHTGDRPFTCKICDYTCSEEAVLKQHERIHTGEKPFRCSICPKSFSASTALSVHMRTHTGFKPLVCRHPGCNKRFSESSNLAKHMRTHSETRLFRCNVQACGKSFQRSDQLKRHKRCVHRSLSPAQCDARLANS